VLRHQGGKDPPVWGLALSYFLLTLLPILVFWAAIGANIFGGGEKWSQFGQLEKNDNIYLQVRYEF